MRTAMGDRALIMEVGSDHAVVLLPGGTFRRVRVPRGETWSVGQEVGLPAPSRRSLVWGAAAAAAVLACVALPLAQPQGTVEAAGVVSLDITPSINLVVDKNGRVLRYQALDAQAQQITRIAPPTGKDLARAVADLTLAAQGKGYLRSGSRKAVDILLGNVAIQAQNPTWFQRAVSAEQQLVSQHHWNAKVYTASLINQQLATQLAKGTPHISVGRYLLWEDAKRHAPASLSLPQAATAALPGLLEKAVSQAASVGSQPSPGPSPSPSQAGSPSHSRSAGRYAGEGAQGSPGHSKSHPSDTSPSPAPSVSTEADRPQISLLPPVSQGSAQLEHAKTRATDKKRSHHSRHASPRQSSHGLSVLQLQAWLERLTGTVANTLDH